MSFGILDGVGRALGFSPWELQDAEEILRDRRGGSPSVRAAEAAARAELYGSASFRLVAGIGEDGQRPAQAGLVMASGPVGTNFVFVSVPAREGTGIYDAGDIYNMMPRHLMITMLIFAGMVCPEDRGSWFELTLHTLFSSGYNTCTHFIKVRPSAGRGGEGEGRAVGPRRPVLVTSAPENACCLPM